MDYISNLPDAIISYILSFLPTKSAVKTCILSKRWQYVWTKVPALDFTELPHSLSRWSLLSGKQRRFFKNFVNNVLLLNDVSCLRCFTLDSYAEFDYEYIESWLRSVAGREMCELNVRFDRPDTFYLPRQFLSGQRLVVLNLKGFMISSVGLSFHLPNLESIHLVSIRFDGDQFLKSLISGCTALKKLYLEGCYGFDKTLYVDSSNLESLEIQESLIEWDDVLPSTHIRTPNLRYLRLQDVVANYNIGELKLLTEANLDLWDSRDYADTEYHALQLIKKVSGVKSLRLGRSDVVCCFDDVIPNFENLTELKLTADFVMYELLESAPKLKSLIIEDVDFEFVDESFYSKAPGCMSCLENVDFFMDNRHHIRLVEHILKVATALKKMTIYLHPMDIEDERTMYQSLLNHPRSSPFCQVKVVHLDQ